ncbi:MAG TPA: hypothetical protein VK386_01315 [Acidimicrobiales bacterium]|nr:hypothetical protein [Acidimicrobiales bacterium]
MKLPPARQSIGAAVVIVGSILGLAGCAHSNAQALVNQACTHVDKSLSLYQASTGAPSSATSQADGAAALQQLRDALPLAAAAAGEDPEWQAFMTTLSETSRVPEADLVTALSQQCSSVADGGIGPVSPPTSVAPVPTKPEIGQ